MKEFRTLSLWTIIALLAGSLAACSDSDELTPEQWESAQITEKLAGSWLFDIDGTDYDIAFMELKLSQRQNAAAIGFWIYNQEDSDYLKLSLPINYQVIRNTANDAADNVLRLVIDTTAFYAQNPELKEAKMDDVNIDYRIRRIDKDSLIVCANSDQTTSVNIAFSREAFDETKTDKARVQQFVKELIAKQEAEAAPSDETDYYSYPDSEDMEYIAQNFPDSPVNKAPQGTSRAVLSPSDLKLDSWMADIDDETLICDLCIPSAHDCTTYNIRKIMAPFGISQAYDLEEQFERGVRVFDLRIRNRFSWMANSCFHDCLDCNMEFTNALDVIVEMVTADGSQEGAIVWVSPEKNNVLGDKGTEIATTLGDLLFQLDFDSSTLDRPACVKKAVEELGEHLLEKNCLATFKRDMKMKDLRRKVLVIFDNPTEDGQTVDWKELAGYIAVRDGRLTRPDGKEVAEIHTQNDWGQSDDGQTREQFNRIKKKKFIDMLHGFASKRDTTWIFNACNAYYWDPYPCPNYAAFAAQMYPTFTKHLNLVRTRGIFQTDYCGANEFTRITLSQVIGIASGHFLSEFAPFIPPLIVSEGGYWIAWAIKTPDKVKSDVLLKSMIYNNFRNFK